MSIRIMLRLGAICAASLLMMGAAPTVNDTRLREIFATAIGMPTSIGLGNVPKLAAYLAAQFRAAGFPETDIHIVPLGENVSAGQPVGAIHFLENPQRDPALVVALSDGVLVATRAPSIVSQGDCVACIAHDVDPRTLA